MAVLAGEQVQGALAVAGFDAGFVLDVDIVEQDTVLAGQLVDEKGAVRLVGVLYRLQPAHAAAEADEDDLAILVSRPLDDRQRLVPGRFVFRAPPRWLA